jgi:hypothetical protein
MAPEQVRGEAGQSADIFAWGLTVAYAASGQPPFGAAPADVIFYRILHDDPDTEAVPGSLKPLVDGALARKPENRPTARDLLTALAAGADEAPAAAAPGVALQAMLSRTWVVPARRLPDATLVRRPRRRNLTSRYPFLLPSAGVAAILICAGVAFGVSSIGQSRPAPAALDPTSRMCGLPPSLYACLPTASNSFYLAPPTAEPAYTPPPNTPPALSTISPTPFGPCQAGCPSFMPTPADVTVSGNASADDLWLEQEGYQPLQGGLGWGESYNTLNVILARKFGSTTGGIRAFFFGQDSYIGNDVPPSDGSNSAQAFRLAEDTIDIRYHLVNAPASIADVRFQLVNNKLIRLDPIPPGQYRRW